MTRARVMPVCDLRRSQAEEVGYWENDLWNPFCWRDKFASPSGGVIVYWVYVTLR